MQNFFSLWFVELGSQAALSIQSNEAFSLDIWGLGSGLYRSNFPVGGAVERHDDVFTVKCFRLCYCKNQTWKCGEHL